MALKKPFKRHYSFYIAFILGLIAFAISLFYQRPLAYTIGANVFFLAYLIAVFLQLPALTAAYLKKNARRTDIPVSINFAITVAVICVAFLSVFELIASSKNPSPFALVFSLVSIPLGWLTIHAMAALHYAHLYWFAGDAGKADGNKSPAPHGGLDFPGQTQPAGWDFLYFATVIGMTAQTADTDITTTPMRRAVLLHSIVSFFFNTVIVASAVNVAVSIGH
ncbi:MAG TPA: DUF1345 domain-containing protein [Rhizobiaceae bacterium]|nr:DUF1345 domain-containing protein [Rhizobiaceae bacterium]